MVSTMAKELICAFCGKKLTEESPHVDEPSYVIDSDRDVVCMACFHSKIDTPCPQITTYPEEHTFWVDEVFSGSDEFQAEWIDDNKYHGHWELSSTTYDPIEFDDLEATVAELEESGTPYAIVEMNGTKEIWARK